MTSNDGAGRRETNMRKKDQHILAAATKLFAKNGFESTKISDVAAKAKVAVGTIYLRYPNKPALLKSVLESFESRFVDAILDPSIHNAAYPKRFHNIFTSIFKTVELAPEFPAILRLAYYLEVEDWTPGKMVREAIASVIAESQTRNELRKDVSPEIVAAISHGMVEGVLRHLISSKSNRQHKVLLGTLVDVQARWLMPNQ